MTLSAASYSKVVVAPVASVMAVVLRRAS